MGRRFYHTVSIICLYMYHKTVLSDLLTLHSLTPFSFSQHFLYPIPLLAPYNAVGTITPLYRHFLGFIRSPLSLSTFFRAPHALYPSFILCTTSLSHPSSAATCDLGYLTPHFEYLQHTAYIQVPLSYLTPQGRLKKSRGDCFQLLF